MRPKQALECWYCGNILPTDILGCCPFCIGSVAKSRAVLVEDKHVFRLNEPSDFYSTWYFAPTERYVARDDGVTEPYIAGSYWLNAYLSAQEAYDADFVAEEVERRAEYERQREVSRRHAVTIDEQRSSVDIIRAVDDMIQRSIERYEIRRTQHR